MKGDSGDIFVLHGGKSYSLGMTQGINWIYILSPMSYSI